MLVVGAVAVGQGWSSRDQSVAPSDHLPAPAPLDGPHLSAATAGWTPGWTERTTAARLELQQTFGGPCSYSVGSAAHPAEAGFTYLGNAQDDLAVAMMGDFGSRTEDAQAVWHRLERQLARCSGAEQITSFVDPSGARGETFQVTSDQAGHSSAYVWIGTTRHGVGVLSILDASDPLPTTNDRPVADALLAAIQAPASYVQRDSASDGSGRIAMSTTDFGNALGSWQSGWSPTTGDARARGGMAPCGASLSDGAAFGEGEALGGNGEQGSYAFTTVRAADAALQSIEDALSGCGTGAYDVRVVRIAGGEVVVAVGSGPSADVVWLVQRRKWLTHVVIPAGTTAPPRTVTKKIGDLLLFDLEAKAATR